MRALIKERWNHLTLVERNLPRERPLQQRRPSCLVARSRRRCHAAAIWLPPTHPRRSAARPIVLPVGGAHGVRGTAFAERRQGLRRPGARAPDRQQSATARARSRTRLQRVASSSTTGQGACLWLRPVGRRGRANAAASRRRRTRPGHHFRRRRSNGGRRRRRRRQPSVAETTRRSSPAKTSSSAAPSRRTTDR
jgi:hypothetical protein